LHTSAMEIAGREASSSRAHAPQKLVGHQRRRLHKEGAHGSAGQAQGRPQVPAEIHPPAPQQRQIDQHFQHPGDQRAPRRACYAHGGRAQLAEDQNVVAYGVGGDGTQTDQHRQPVQADGAQGKHANVADGRRQIADADHRQIAEAQQNGVFILHKQSHDLPGQQLQQHKKHHGDRQAQKHLQGKQTLTGLVVLRAVVLADHQSRPAGQPEEQAGKDRIGLVGHADGAHGQPVGVQTAHHQVVHHVEKAVDELLHRHGQHHAQRTAAKFLIRPVEP